MKTSRLALIAMAVVLAIFAFGPLVNLLTKSLWLLRGEAIDEMVSPAARAALRTTLSTSLGAAAFALLLGAPIALLLTRTDLPGRQTLRTLFTAPSAIPPFIWGMGWVSLANPKAGFLNQLLGEGRLDIYGSVGIAFVLGTVALPIVLLLVGEGSVVQLLRRLYANPSQQRKCR